MTGLRCTGCGAPAHDAGNDMVMTGCGCVPLVLGPTRLSAAVRALAAAFDAQDVAEHRAVADVRRQFAPILAQRRAEWQRAGGEPPALSNTGCRI